MSQSSMHLAELVERLQIIEPEANDADIARFAWILAQQLETMEILCDEGTLSNWLIALKQSIASLDDQRCAVRDELQQLAVDQPVEFDTSHIWTLVRSIRTQEQILDFYQI